MPPGTFRYEWFEPVNVTHSIRVDEDLLVHNDLGLLVGGSFDEFAAVEGGAGPDERDRRGVSTARQRSWAASMSLNAIASPAVRGPGPLVTLVRSRTVAKVAS